MKLLVAILFVAACGGPKPKQESPLVKEGSAVPETCCCKSTPIAAPDGKPVFEDLNRMDCSTKQGDCVDSVQCQKSEPAPSP